MELNLTHANELPPDLEPIVGAISSEAADAAFKLIADRLGGSGYPVTGDMTPHEVLAIDEAFDLFVRAMALNNAKVNEFTEIRRTEEIVVELDACEPMELLRNPTDNVWVRIIPSEQPSGQWPVVQLRGPRAAVESFVRTHWGDDPADELGTYEVNT